MQKKVPVRMCIACREGKPKRELIRVVKKGKAPGRGAYICPDMQCFDKAYKSKALSRALDAEISPEVYEELKRAVLRYGIGG